MKGFMIFVIMLATIGSCSKLEKIATVMCSDNPQIERCKK